MTENEKAEFDLLKLANKFGKFAVHLAFDALTEQQQFALERLQVRRWVTLIDVSPIATSAAGMRVMRIFLASDEAMRWFRAQG